MNNEVKELSEKERVEIYLERMTDKQLKIIENYCRKVYQSGIGEPEN